MKTREYDLTRNVGRAKYVITYISGERVNPDGSQAIDIAIFKAKKKANEFIKGHLLANGFRPNFGAPYFA